jgi:hypothetical protein
MSKFYVIKIVNIKTGIKGFLSIVDNELVVSEKVIGETINFDSFQQAKSYISENKIERKGISCLIYSNEEILDTKQGGRALEEEAFYIERIDGLNVFYNNLIQDYYLDNKSVGFCIWRTRNDAEDFIKNIKSEGNDFVIVTLNPND